MKGLTFIFKKGFLAKVTAFFGYIALAFVIMFFTFLVERLISFILTRVIGRAIKKVGAAPTNFVFFGYLVSGLIYIGGFILAI